MVRFFAGRKKAYWNTLFILQVKRETERERESGETDREGEKERERGERQTERGRNREREGRDRQRKRDGVIVARLHKCMHEYKCKIVFKYYTRLTELT